MIHAGVVADRARGERGELVEDVRRARIGEGVFPAHLVGEADEDLRVGQRLARGLRQLGQIRETALGIGHDAVLLRPLGGGQEDVGEARGLRRMVGVLDDHQLGLTQSLLHEVEVGHRGGRVGADDPHRPHLARGEALEDLEGRPPGARRDGLCGQAPRALDEARAPASLDGAIAGQQVRQAARLPAAHGVRLAGERERSAPGPPDLSGGQMQVDDRGILVGADVALVDPHAPEAERRARRAERGAPPCGWSRQRGR